MSFASIMLVGSLAACGDDDDTSSTTTTDVSTTTTIATTTTTAEATTTETRPVPTGLPDPQTLVGREIYLVREAPGVSRVFIDDHPTELAEVGGSCFQGPAPKGDFCAYSLAIAYRTGPSPPAPANSALLLLEQFRSRRADGTANWVIVDAVITTTPDGEPQWLQICEFEETAAFYGSVIDGRYTATAAWAPNPDATALGTVDPASLNIFNCYPDTGPGTE